MVSDLGGDPRVTQVYGDFSPAKERPQATSTVLWPNTIQQDGCTLLARLRSITTALESQPTGPVSSQQAPAWVVS